MSRIIADSVKLGMLDGYSQTPAQAWAARLYANDAHPAGRMTMADFTEISFSGYSPVEFAFAPAALDADGNARAAGPLVTFSHDGNAQTASAFGWYVTDKAGTRVVSAGRFASPVAFGKAGDALTIKPGLYVGAALDAVAGVLPWPVTEGGTGLATVGPNALLAGGAAPTDPLVSVGPGAVGQVMGSNGPGAPPAFRDVLGKTNGSSYLNGNQTWALGSGVWGDVNGVSVTFPADGVYSVSYRARMGVNVQTGNNPYVAARLTLNGAVAPDSETMLFVVPTLVTHYQQQCSATLTVSATANAVMKLQVKRDGTSVVWNACTVSSDAAGRTGISWHRIA